MTDTSLRILVVDDEPSLRKGCRKILEAEGYEVETAEDGLAGLELFEKQRNFVAALIDLKMPRMDGVELIERIREQDESIVLFVITAYASIETAVEVTKKGAYDYIPKPFTPDELLRPLQRGLAWRQLLLESKRLREEREKRLLELASERSQSHTIIKCMTDGVLVINRDGQLVLQNSSATSMLMEHTSEPLPTFLLNALDCPDMPALLNNMIDQNAEPVIISKELSLGQRTYMMNVSPVMQELQEGPAGIVVVLRDITALKQLEIAKSMFVSMVAHELKSPLSAVESYLNLILRGTVAGDSEKAHNMLERSLLRLSTLQKMISELMNLTAMETGKFSITRSHIDFGHMLAEAVASCQEDAQQKNITISLSCESSPPVNHVLADRDAMLIVFRNLIHNAVKYNNDNGHVDILVHQKDNYLVVTVQDDGVGMTLEDRERVFEEFFRAKNRKTSQTPGTGLGLSLVKRLVDMHHGTIAVSSELDKGSVFTVSIPMKG